MDNYYQERQTVGLNNIGNTCYMNSTLQLLNSCKIFINHFLNENHKNNINYINPFGKKGIIATEYAKLVQEMNLRNINAVSPV